MRTRSKAVLDTRAGQIFAAFLAISAGMYAQNPGGFITSHELSFAGNWYPAPHEENLGNPDLIDYLGVPINESARAWALAWDPSRVTLPEHQCQVHVSPYIYGGPMNLAVWEEREPQSKRLIAIKQYISNWEQERTIWMDERPHPPEWVPHTWMGFSTGKWDGNSLTIYTTHIKQGWLRRNGLPESDRATMTEHFMRHGNYLTHVSVVTDPVYLTEPFTKSQVFILDTDVAQNWLYPCDYVVEIAGRKQGFVPHYLPGKNPFLNEFAERTGLPVEATLGGAETMYPDYQKKLGTAVTKRR